MPPRYLALGEVLDLHGRVIAQAGGADGVRDLGAIESAVAQPRAAFGGADLHPTLADTAAALGYALIQNHAFVDGNERVGHAALETFLVLNGHELRAAVGGAEQLVLAVASGACTRDALATWVAAHLVPLAPWGLGFDVLSGRGHR